MIGGHWTFAQKIGAGFLLVVALTVVLGALAVQSLRDMLAEREHLFTTFVQPLIDAQRMTATVEHSVASSRGYVLTRDEDYVQRARQSRSDYLAMLERTRRTTDSAEEQALLDALALAEAEHWAGLEKVFALVRSNGATEAIVRLFDEHVQPRRERLRQQANAFVAKEERLMQQARDQSRAAAAASINLMVGVAAAAAVIAAVLALVLGRTLSRQIGSAVSHVQSSSVELQAAANQQSAGAREQATAVSEIGTTVSELLASSRQIAESTQRVAQVAEETAGAARGGEGRVDQAHESIAGIRRQVDTIVGHMLDLGRKSQQIGAVLDIVAELAEQTNILAINATIEAAGAGESGKRFAVVADEIRALADRVGGSAKEIRVLVDDVRGAVNTTVMATETGSKAVDAGSQQFADVALAFKQIAALVATTTEAAREIELSTKQQASAVEQVNIAIGSVAQTTRETEASSGQTLATVSQLASLSKDLLRLVRPQAVLSA
ncbi:CHASE3 domain-containing protein [Aquincola sp. S2]|uniref:CHASE3 domain-containing protein n=1 Tax=Pseudaquabacterium terrae TaxID=2732868 RepID=A0ABX2EHR7_9BURK|nr:methyl-accepting chemotaxis protein [Aquabacterium terrae]NRF68124.1 CHASE3 domain-containing protein [Aquabacterium terrae]